MSDTRGPLARRGPDDARALCARTRGFPHPRARAQAPAHGRGRAEHDLGVRGPPHDPVPGAGDAAHRAHLRARGHPGGARRLQPADPGRRQLEGDDDDRVPRRGRARSRARAAARHRGPLLRRGRRPRPDDGDRGRGHRARERREDVGRALAALRARRPPRATRSSRAPPSPPASTIPRTGTRPVSRRRQSRRSRATSADAPGFSAARIAAPGGRAATSDARHRMAQSYTASDIEVLTGLEPVRRRPGMYTDTRSPNHLVHEVVDNSVDEALSGTLRAHRRHPAQGRLGLGRGRRARHAGRHPPEGEGQRRRADPDAPARGREVLGQELRERRRPARRRRVGGQRAVEAPRVQRPPRRQGMEHRLSRRQGRLEARGRRHRQARRVRHHRPLLAGPGVLRLGEHLGAAPQARPQGEGRALPGARVRLTVESSGETEEWYFTGDLGAYLLEQLGKRRAPAGGAVHGPGQGRQRERGLGAVLGAGRRGAGRRELREPDPDAGGRHARQRPALRA